MENATQLRACALVVMAFMAAACKPAVQAPAPSPGRAPGTALTAEEVDKLEQERERKGMRAPDAQKIQRDSVRMEEKSAARAEPERQRLMTDAEKAAK